MASPLAINPYVKAILSVPSVGGRFANPRLLSDSGHFSFVFEATDSVTGRRVVLKFMRPDRQDEYRKLCFHREATIGIELLRHPNVVTALTPIGVHNVPLSLADGTEVLFPFQYFATEMAVRDYAAYLFGPRKRSPALWRRLEIVRDVVKGVARLHQHGYTHRDLKPDNIFLFAGGTAKLGDLGTCRKLSESPIVDAYGGPVGHRRYAAPELFTPGVADDPALMPTADWFAVGAILFESVSGLNIYSAIGLQTVGEIIVSFTRFGSAEEYLSVVGDIAGQYPIPILDDYLPSDLAAKHSRLTIDTIDRLVRRLSHFDFSRRLTNSQKILSTIDVAIASARHDDLKNQRSRIKHTRNLRNNTHAGLVSTL